MLTKTKWKLALTLTAGAAVWDDVPSSPDIKDPSLTRTESSTTENICWQINFKYRSLNLSSLLGAVMQQNEFGFLYAVAKTAAFGRSFLNKSRHEGSNWQDNVVPNRK